MFALKVKLSLGHTCFEQWQIFIRSKVCKFAQLKRSTPGFLAYRKEGRMESTQGEFCWWLIVCHQGVDKLEGRKGLHHVWPGTYSRHLALTGTGAWHWKVQVQVLIRGVNAKSKWRACQHSFGHHMLEYHTSLIKHFKHIIIWCCSQWYYLRSIHKMKSLFHLFKNKWLALQVWETSECTY